MTKTKYPKTGEFKNNFCECGATLDAYSVWIDKITCKCTKCGRNVASKFSEKNDRKLSTGI